MSFKPFRDSRPMSERPIEVQLEAAFFAKLGHLGKKDQGRTMGAFREALENYRVVTAEQRAKMTEFSREEAIAIYDMVAKRQQAAMDCEKSSTNPDLIRNHRECAQLMSAIKVKMMVLMLMEVENEQTL